MKDLIITFLVALVCTSVFNQLKFPAPREPEQNSSNFTQSPQDTFGQSNGDTSGYPAPGPAGKLAAQALSTGGDVFSSSSEAPLPGAKSIVAENSDMPLVDEVGFDRDVIKSASPVLVFFCSNASSPCHEVYSSVQSAAAQLEDSFRVVRVDVQAHPTLAQAYGVSMVPTFMIFKDGRKVTEYTGVMPTNALIALARKSLSAS
jgi:thioredoxin 1